MHFYNTDNVELNYVWPFLLVLLLYALPTILAILKLSRQRQSQSNFLFWLLVVFFFPFLGSIFYLVFGGKRDVV